MGCIGHLHISVVEGRNLVLKVSARPSVLVQLGKEQARTAPLKDLNSKWLSEFRLSVLSEDACLVVTLLDDTHNNPVGRSSFPIRDLIPIGTAVQWVTMKDLGGRDVGQVCLVLRFLKGPPLLQGINGVKHDAPAASSNSMPSRSTLESSEAHSDSSSPSPSRERKQNGVIHTQEEDLSDSKKKREKGSGGHNKYLVAAGAAIALLVGAFAVRNHRRRRSNYYEVKEGDTLCSIADSYGLSPDDVFEANMSVTSDPDRIYPGDKIYIP